MSTNVLFPGNNMDSLKELPDNSVDAVVTDPPYGLSFMGKRWDYDVPSVDLWREVYRVLKPGGHVLSFGGTRTYHRLVVAIEDAGFEIRDQIQWLYGSGFPKSQDVSKQIDKQAGAKREVVGINPSSRPNSKMQGSRGFDGGLESETSAGVQHITAPATDAAKTWQGWGTALKPANEPICVARKPLEKGLTVAANVLKWGTGAINIDETRIEAQDLSALQKNWDREQSVNNKSGTIAREGGDLKAIDLRDRAPQGRWPANVILDEEAAAGLDTQAAEVSRFFYVAKASKRERNAGLEGMPEKESGVKNNSGRGFSEADPYKKVLNQNFHPTVKPVKLMEYLIKLATPKNGIVLDPFMGSGTTGVAAARLGVNFVGMELDENYFKIADARISNANNTSTEEDTTDEEKFNEDAS